VSRAGLLGRRLPGRVAVAVAVLLTAACAAAIPLRIGSGMQRQAADRFFPRGRVDDRLVVVAIDGRSLGQPVGHLWGYRQVSELVDALAEVGAGTVVLDVDFSRLEDSADTQSRGDIVLADAIQRAGNVVVAIPPVELQRPTGRMAGIPRVVQKSTIVTFVVRAGRGFGLGNLTPDLADRVVRSVPLVADDPDRGVVAGLALAALSSQERAPVDLAERAGRVEVGGRRIPITRSGELWVSYAAGLTPGTRAVRQVSAIDVVRGRVPRTQLTGKTVLVGITDPNIAGTWRAPVGPDGELPSVFIHANALNTMLTEAYLEPVAVWETLAWVLALALLVGLLASRWPLWLAPIPAAGAAGLYVVLAAVRFEAGQVMDLSRPLAAVAAAFVAAVLLRAAAELRQRRHVTGLFAQYVPAAVAGQLLREDRVEAAVAGERLEVAVLFCDLRGFTPMAEAMAPSAVRDLLNAYYLATTRIVFDYGGTVMQYVGDEVFAVFGAPIPDPDCAAKALRCARALHEEAPRLGTRLAEAGLPPVAYGIGLHKGEVVAAHVGNDIRRQYAVVGDTVNVGSRLCSRAGAGEIVMSEAVLAGTMRPPVVEPLGPISLKGKREPLHVHRLVVHDLNKSRLQVQQGSPD
jgi:adenylate cyclase